MSDSVWHVYVLTSDSLGVTYVGITTDPQRRLQQHNGSIPGGAKSTRRGRPWTIGIVHGPFESRSEAQRIEYALKRRRGAQRLSWTPQDEGRSGASGPA
ncbi:MAG: putative GIY-YIG superfamily endonuclease [Planctomycetota bacterium]